MKKEVKVTAEDLVEIFGDCENAIAEIKRVFKEHESMKTTILEPNSWVGKELLWQSRTLIDLRQGFAHLAAVVDSLNGKFEKLGMNNTK